MVWRYIMLNAATKPDDEARTLLGVIPPVMVLTNFILVWSLGTGVNGWAAFVDAEGANATATSITASSAISRFFTNPPPVVNIFCHSFCGRNTAFKGIYCWLMKTPRVLSALIAISALLLLSCTPAKAVPSSYSSTCLERIPLYLVRHGESECKQHCDWLVCDTFDR